jgi:hypothetical protein
MPKGQELSIGEFWCTGRLVLRRLAFAARPLDDGEEALWPSALPTPDDHVDGRQNGPVIPNTGSGSSAGYLFGRGFVGTGTAVGTAVAGVLPAMVGVNDVLAE